MWTAEVWPKLRTEPAADSALVQARAEDRPKGRGEAHGGMERSGRMESVKLEDLPCGGSGTQERRPPSTVKLWPQTRCSGVV